MPNTLTDIATGMGVMDPNFQRTLAGMGVDPRAFVLGTSDRTTAASVESPLQRHRHVPLPG